MVLHEHVSQICSPFPNSIKVKDPKQQNKKHPHHSDEKEQLLGNMIATSLPFASVLPHSRCNLCRPNSQGVEATFWLYSVWLWTNITHPSTPPETVSAVLEIAAAGWVSLSPCLTYKMSIIVWSQIHGLAHCLVTLQWQCVSNTCSKDNLNSWQQMRVKTGHIFLSESSMQGNLHTLTVFYGHLHRVQM